MQGDLNVGSRVTIYYSMLATAVEVKESKANKVEGKKEKKESEK